MKKKTKNLLLLVGLLLVVAVGYFALDLVPEKTAEEEQTVEETVKIADFTTEDIIFYCYSNSNYEMGFNITENGYVHYKDEAFPANTAAVEAQLVTLEGLTAVKKIDSTEKEEYGLDVPSITVAATLSDGRERTFFFGDSAPLASGYYLLDVENNVIYLVESSVYLRFDSSWSSMIQQEEMSLPTSDQIVDVTVETEGTKTMYIFYDEAKEQPWQLTTPEGTFDGDMDAVATALGVYSTYSLLSTIEYNCNDFAQYGLEEPVTTVTVRYTEEEDTAVKALVFAFGNADADNNASYVRINGSDYVYSMSEYYAESIAVFDVEELKYQPETEAGE